MVKKIWNSTTTTIENALLRFMEWYEYKVWNPMVKHFRITLGVVFGTVAVLHIVGNYIL